MTLSDVSGQEHARLIEELTYYVKIASDDKDAAKPIDRDELILRARELRSSMSI